jgi:hypothetical protein
MIRQRTSMLRYTYTVCLNRPGFLLASNKFSVISCVVHMFSYPKYINIPVSFALRQSAVCRDSSVGIASRYRLHGPGSNAGGREIFRTCSDRPWGPHSVLYNGYRISFSGVQRPHLPPMLKKEYSSTSTSPLGCYGLFQGEIYHYFYGGLRFRRVYDMLWPGALTSPGTEFNKCGIEFRIHTKQLCFAGRLESRAYPKCFYSYLFLRFSPFRAMISPMSFLQPTLFVSAAFQFSIWRKYTKSFLS